MIGFEREKLVSAHRETEPRLAVSRASLRPGAAGGAVHPVRRHGPAEAPASPVPAWWPRLRTGLPSLAVALLLAAFAVTQLYWRSPAPLAGTPTLVVWRAPGQEAVALSAVNEGEWRAFIASRREARAQTKRLILEQARSEMMAALAPVFDEIKGRVKDYVRWFYFFPTTYRMAFTSVIAVLSKDAGDGRAAEQVATDALNRLLQDRFLEVVVVPEKFGPVVDARARAVQKRAIERATSAGEREIAALSDFMAAHGQPAASPPAAGSAGMVARRPVVVSWEALSLPAPPSAMSAPPDAVALIKADPAFSGMQTTVSAEGLMLLARQLARRMVNSSVATMARTMVLPMVAGGALGPAEAIVSPALGIAAFGIGVGAEFGTVKMREMVEGQHLTDISTSIVDHLREHQSAVLVDGVAQRVETWLGE